MKKHFIIIFLLSLLTFSCKEKSIEKLTIEKKEILKPNVNFNELKTDYMKWWNYHTKNITLSSQFISINEKSDTIEKKLFLEKLTSGKFIPLRFDSKDKTEFYKLYKLDTLANESIGSTIKNVAITSLKHYNMEGKSFPEFDFTDLNGNNYTNKNTKGKTVIIKTWFINCMACIAEFPELNELVEKHKNDEDIIFLSLALDSKPKLEAFLKAKNFEYEVVANQKEFIEKKLSLQAYPTHLIIDKNGIITKVVNKASEMILSFENEIKLTKTNLPPPPM